MRKILFWFFTLFIWINAQGQLSTGVRYGYNNTGLYLEPTPLQENQTDFFQPSYGLVFIYNNSLNAGFQAEINLTQKGWREEDEEVPGSYFQRSLSYLEIPLLSHFEMGYKAVRPIISAGPYLGFKLSDSSDSLNYGHVMTNHQYNHYEQEIKTFHYGIKINLGLRYNINNHLAIYAEGRYDLDLAGSRDVFIDRPNNIQASRLKEIGLTFGLLWHIVPQEEKKEQEGYIPKEDL